MKLIHGHGINDKSRPARINSKRLIQYELWIGMIRRCYSDNERNKFKSYSDCSVSDNFKRYSYFYDWYNSNIVNSKIKYDLDKDLLIKGNRVYSEETCVLIPRKLNLLLVLKKSQRGRYLIGVTFGRRQKKFQSQISINGKNIHIGYFNSEIDAYSAYKNRKESYVKDMADKWKGQISPKAYNALMSYTVDIID